MPRNGARSNQNSSKLTRQLYAEMYRRSVDHPDEFWSEQADLFLDWFHTWDSVLKHDIKEARVEWFSGGSLNGAYNCLTRRLPDHAGTIAFHSIPDDNSPDKSYTYGALAAAVDNIARKFSNAGICAGDVVVVHLPHSIELVGAVLALNLIGATYCVVYSGYGAESLAYRILTTRAKALVTCDARRLSDRLLSFHPKVEYAKTQCDTLEHIFYFDKYATLPSDVPRDHVLDIDDTATGDEIQPAQTDAGAPLFIMHAAPAIGKSRALVHSNGGYLLWAAITAKYVFQLSGEDVIWVTSDLSRNCGHALGLFGTLLNGATGVICEANPLELDQNRLEEIIEEYSVTQFCAGGSIIRRVRDIGAGAYTRRDLSSLRILASAGEALKANDWIWFSRNFGNDKLPVVTTWGQAETGGPMISNLAGIATDRPGSVGLPLFGVSPAIYDLDTGEETTYPNQEGALFITKPWPGMAVTIYGDHESYKDAYFGPFAGKFLTGEGAKIDENGCFWVTGRIDDIINVAGHRIGAWELEAALSSHDSVVEAAAVGFPHKIKGQGIYAFVKLDSDDSENERVKREIQNVVTDKLGDMAAPDVIQWTGAMPKTRSGKILRRVLQKIAAGQVDALGELATVADPKVVQDLVQNRPESD